MNIHIYIYILYLHQIIIYMYIYIHIYQSLLGCITPPPLKIKTLLAINLGGSLPPPTRLEHWDQSYNVKVIRP